MIDHKRELEAIRQQLGDCVDPTYQEGSARVAPTAQEVLGVRTPDQRRIARSWRAQHGGIDEEELLSFVQSLWHAPSREERSLSLFLLASYPKLVTKLPWSWFEAWRHDLDNWVICDQVSTMILGPWVEMQLATRLGYLDQLIQEDDIWSRRMALVATVPINRNPQGGTIPDRTFSYIGRVAHERHPMISKAVSWALRELTKTHPQEVTDFLHDHEQQLASHVVREVNNKLETGLKAGRR